jgi:hypothetical protein
LIFKHAKAYVKPGADKGKFYGYIERLYKCGGWIITGLDKYQLDGQFIYDEKN